MAQLKVSKKCYLCKGMMKVGDKIVMVGECYLTDKKVSAFYFDEDIELRLTFAGDSVFKEGMHFSCFINPHYNKNSLEDIMKHQLSIRKQKF